MATMTAAVAQQAARGVVTTRPARHVQGEVALTLDAAPTSASRARRATREVLADWDVDGKAADDILLMVDELVTNALKYGYGPVSLRLRLHRRRVVACEVGDASGELPRRGDGGPLAESGRGMLLVDALADTLGIRSTATGKVVWFRRRVSPRPRA